jgi:hypothetical protein
MHRIAVSPGNMPGADHHQELLHKSGTTPTAANAIKHNAPRTGLQRVAGQ